MKIFAFAAASVVALGTALSAQAQQLRLSHQWSTADIRHKVAEMIAEEVEAADVGLSIRIFPSASLFSATEQYQPVSRGQLDMTVYPLSYAGGLRPEFNLTLMPGIVRNHDHGARLNDSEFMQRLEALMAEDDIKVLVHGYLAGGFASKGECITRPEHMEGRTVRAAGRGFEQMLAAAGASISSMASSEIYNGMQTGVLDAVNTSSSSFVSFRLYEQVDCYTPAGDIALWFMYQPLLMNKSTFERLTEEQQEVLLAASARAEEWYLEQAKIDDERSVEVFRNNDVQIAEMTAEDFEAWRSLALESAYQDFLSQVPNGQELLDLAFSVE
ncbi:MAG: TRAP transporter substrate-binding protein DctP [Natronohydrobacter sp.]|nr:TRAP transporter substrate-binding protein DctP [Natronohydrobacter sp.]